MIASPQVIIESRKGFKAKVADGPDDPLPREVKLSQLRPRYTWHDWSGGWKYMAEGRERHIAPGPAPLVHNLPPTGGEGGAGVGAARGATSKGRAVTKPKRALGDDDANDSSATMGIVPLVDPERVPKVCDLPCASERPYPPHTGFFTYKPTLAAAHPRNSGHLPTPILILTHLPRWEIS